MIQGIGSDIVSIIRIQSMVEKWGERFLNRIFTKKELAHAALRKAGYYSYLAKRFAAKEALSKALGRGIGCALSFSECEVLNDESGAPYFNILRDDIRYKIHLSLSDEREYALAFVILEKY